MKKRFLAVLAVLVAVMLTGCMRVNVGIDVKSDGKADISLLYAMSDELMSSFSDEDDDDAESESVALNAEEIKELEDEGWVYKEYKEDGYSGYLITKQGVDLKELADSFKGAGSETGLGSDDFVVKEENGVYTIDWKVLDSEDAEESSEYAEYFDQFNGYMRLVITLPEGSIKNNATEVSEDGKTLTWNLLKSSDSAAHVEFKLPSNSGLPMVTIIIIVVVVLAILVIIIAIILANKNKKSAVAPTVEAEPETTDNTDNN